VACATSTGTDADGSTGDGSCIGVLDPDKDADTLDDRICKSTCAVPSTAGRETGDVTDAVVSVASRDDDTSSALP